MTWDHFEDLRAALDKYSEANGISYILVMVQAGSEKENGEQRFLAKACGEFTEGPAVITADEALAEVFADAYAHFGIEDEDEDDPLA